jgi:hypothetical protein
LGAYTRYGYLYYSVLAAISCTPKHYIISNEEYLNVFAGSAGIAGITGIVNI